MSLQLPRKHLYFIWCFTLLLLHTFINEKSAFESSLNRNSFYLCFLRTSPTKKQGISWFHRCHIFIVSSTHKKEKSQVKFVPHNLWHVERKITFISQIFSLRRSNHKIQCKWSSKHFAPAFFSSFLILFNNILFCLSSTCSGEVSNVCRYTFRDHLFKISSQETQWATLHPGLLSSPKDP